MRSTSSIRSVRAALLVAFAGATLGASVAAAKPTRPRASRLFASAGYLFQVNQQVCGVDNIGEVCVAFAGSPVGGGGFWPKGTPDQYIFNSGLQLAGIIRNSPFPHPVGSSDTVGAFFFDPRGDQAMGDPQSLVFSRLEPADVSTWSSPPTKTVLDPNIYNPILLGSDAISQGDVFVRYWEGNPGFLTGRTHPMGIAVDERILAWNYPSGNEDIIYIIYTFYNVTARSTSGKYTNSTIPGLLQTEIAAIGDQFQDINEAKFKVTIPDTGYTIDSLYVAQGMDADVAVFNQNYATAFIPFNVGAEYTGTFLPDVGWQYPPTIFGPPFAAATGFIGIKYLRSPTDASGKQVGLTMFSQELNSATGFPDAVGVNQLYRYLSGFLGPADNPCNPSPGPPGTPTTDSLVRARRYCFLGQLQGDARFYQASGPLALPPGEARSVVVAYINAAPYNGTGTPYVKKGASFDTKPGTSGVGLTAVQGDSIRLIDKIAGWVSSSALLDSTITQDQVTVVPRSLLGKALVAQAVYDNGFLLPFSPDAPNFYLVPGNNQVTVVWTQSRSETFGDPFYAIASLDSVLVDPANPGLGKKANPLFDPDFRQFDVEGYRIYRGRTANLLELVAQFDYAGTSFVDYTGQIDYGDRNGDGLLQCAPELGLQQDCPVTFAANPVVSGPTPSPSFATGLAGDIIQIPPGGRTELFTTGVINLKADTAVVTQSCVSQLCPSLKDTGVPFVYVDKNVLNSFSYVYAVTAFDLNSIKSGPTSLESPRVTKKVTPRRAATNQGTPAGPVTFATIGGDGSTLNPNAANPTIDATKGTFSGPAVPTGRFEGLGVSLFADQLIKPNSQALIRIDSVTPGFQTVTYYFSGLGPVSTASKFGPDGVLGVEDGTITFGPASAVIPADTNLAKAQKLGPVPFAAQFTGQTEVGAVTETSKDIDWHTDVNGSFFDAVPGMNADGGSRWFDGANETMADPTLTDPVSKADLHGQLTGVTKICRPVRLHPCGPGVSDTVNALFRRFDQETRLLFRAADMKVYWGTTPGKVDSVIDVTHHVAVPFNAQNRASYGFRTDVVGTTIGTASAPDGVVTYVDFLDGACLPGASSINNTGCETRGYADSATLGPVDVTGDKLSDGNGFGMYINGKPVLFLTNTLPASPTVWTLRTYFGLVSKASGSYAFAPTASNPPVPGLRLAAVTSTPAVIPPNSPADLSRVHTVPDPYYVANALEITANQKFLKFVNVPEQCLIRIYSVSGVLVNIIPVNDPTGGGEATWNLRNRNNQFVASGVYFYHIETPGGQTKVGRFTVVNFAP